MHNAYYLPQIATLVRCQSDLVNKQIQLRLRGIFWSYDLLWVAGVALGQCVHELLEKSRHCRASQLDGLGT